MKKVNVIIGQILYDFRHKTRPPMSQAKLAQMIQLSQSSYSAIERGESDVTIDTLFKISKKTKIPMSEFIAAIQEKSQKKKAKLSA